MNNIVIIGAGLVGSSIGMALIKAGYQVFLEDQVRSHSTAAAALGAGTVSLPDPDSVDLVVAAVPPQALPGVITDSLTRFRNATVTDVGSVKAYVVEQLANLDLSRYVPSHPMAGSQYSGPLTADANLFLDRTWVITALAANPKSDIDRVHTMATDCGAKVITMTPAEHDLAVAQLSHIPHLMSILTASHLRNMPSQHLKLAGQGVRDVTRIAGSDPGLWKQIINANATAVRAGLEDIRADLDELITRLEDPAALEILLSQGRSGAASLRGKRGQPETGVTVVVEIPDEPRALARLFTDVADLGINVEDVRIEHDQVREVGYLAIQVIASDVETLTTDIVRRGWKVKPITKEG